MVATDLPGPALEALRKAGAETRPADILNGREMTAVMEGCDAVIHLAAVFDLGAPLDLLRRVNVGGTEVVCGAACDLRVRRMVMLSSVAVYGQPSVLPCPEEAPKRACDAYGLTKWESERVAMRFHAERGLPVVAVRPSLIYGPGSRYGQALYFALFAMHRALERTAWPVWPMPRANQAHVLDVCRAIRFLLDRDDAIGRAFNVADDDPLALDEAFEIIMAKVGVRPVRIASPAFAGLVRRLCWAVSKLPMSWFNPLNRWVYRVWLRVCEAQAIHSPLKPRLDRDWLDYLSHDRIYDNRRLKEMGFQFTYPKAREVLGEVIDWYARERWIPSVPPPAVIRQERQVA